MSNYRRGANFERQCRTVLSEMGYNVVRAAGSHTPTDLVAWRSGSPLLLIQCKRDGRLPKDEARKLLVWADEANTPGRMESRPLLASKAGRGTIEWLLVTGEGKDDYEIYDVEEGR